MRTEPITQDESLEDADIAHSASQGDASSRTNFRSFFPLLAYLSIYPVLTGYWVEGWIQRTFTPTQAVFVKAELYLPAVALLSMSLLRLTRERRLSSDIAFEQACRRLQGGPYRYVAIAVAAFSAYIVGIMSARLGFRDFDGAYRPHFEGDPFEPIALWIGAAFVVVMLALTRLVEGFMRPLDAPRCPACRTELFARQATDECPACGERVRCDSE
ncbi:MAG: hypothetical protein QM811_27580 [Pirellulales bacterium]